MNTLQNSDTFQKFMHYIFSGLGCVAAVSMGAFLLLAWILMSPLLRLGGYLGGLYRSRLHQK